MSRNKILAAVAIIVGLFLVIFVVVTDFPPEDSSVAGTMADPDKKVAGMEKADRSRSDQTSPDAVITDEATFQKLMQNEDFVAVVTSGEFALIDAMERTVPAAALTAIMERLAEDEVFSLTARELALAAENEEEFRLAVQELRTELERALEGEDFNLAEEFNLTEEDFNLAAEELALALRDMDLGLVQAYERTMLLLTEEFALTEDLRLTERGEDMRLTSLEWSDLALTLRLAAEQARTTEQELGLTQKDE